MTYGPTYSGYGGLSRLVSVLLVIWLIIGAIAAGQRDYYSSAKNNCASVATITVTILAGPLNYLGVNPKVHCTTPQPSK
jgi:membrane protein YdbS with pleckstrin-like domain